MIDNYCFSQEIGTNCIYLVYRLNEGDVVDDIEHKMITNNKISGLLTVMYCGTDCSSFYKYDISSKITLANYIQSLTDSKKLLSIIIHICEALINTGKYLIENESIILENEYIYIDITSLEVYMICLPVYHNNKNDLKYLIKDLIFQYRACERADLSVIGEVFDYINNDRILLLNDFCSFIKSIYSGISKTEINKSDNLIINNNVDDLNNNKVKSESQNISIGTKANIKANKTVQQRNDEKNSSTGIVSKRPYKNEFVIPNTEQKQQKKQKYKIKNIKDNEKIKKRTIKVHGNSSDNFFKRLKGKIICTFGRYKKKISNASKARVIVQEPQQVESYIYSDKTEFIGANIPMSNASPYIIRMSNDEKVFIDKEVFKMGKDMEYSDFLIKDNPTISRAHAEIIKVDDNYYLKDNNSKNHTYVNDEVVIGSNKVKLSHNTRFRLSNEEFIFKLY